MTDIDFIDYTYATPRGKMRMAAGQRFSTAYKFSGVLPWFAAPKEMPDLGNPYNRERMRQMIADYAQRGHSEPTHIGEAKDLHRWHYI